jgi:hypothetical protein
VTGYTASPIQWIIRKSLIARCVLVIDDAVNIAIIAVAEVEVIPDREHGRTRGGCRHGHRLQALVVAEAVGDGGRSAAAAEEVGQREIWPVYPTGDVIDPIAQIFSILRRADRN